MGAFILVVMLHTYGAQHSAISMQEFSDAKSCQYAASRISARDPGANVFCVSKGAAP